MTDAEKPRPSGRPAIPAPKIGPLDRSGGEAVERQVYAALRRALMSGAILPGAKVSSRPVAAALGVSTMPVREALKRLESEGAIQGAAKSGFVVRAPTPRDFAEILQIRLRLEVMLGCAAVGRMTSAEMELAGRLQDEMTRAPSWGHALHLNYQMHFLIYRAADLPYALSLVENIWLKVGPALHAHNADRPDPEAFANHEAILHALRASDEAAMATAIRRDLSQAADVLLLRLAGLRTTEPLPGGSLLRSQKI